MPPRCKRGTLPIELIPHDQGFNPHVGFEPYDHLGKTTLAGLEPATLRFEVLRAIHCATGPDMLWFLWDSNPRLQM